MLDHYQAVAWMITGTNGRVSRERMLENQHRADLRAMDGRPSLAARTIGRLRATIAPAPVVRRDPACCVA